MVQNTLNTGFGTLMGDNTHSNSVSTDSTLTPTTLKTVTQIFESQDCLNAIQKFDDDQFAVPLPVTTAPVPVTKSTTSVRRSFINLDSKAWRGGTTTVVTPTSSEPEKVLGIPEPVTISTMTMNTRSSTREQTMYVAKRRQHEQQQVQAPSKAPQQKKKTAGRRPGGRTTRIDEEDLTPEEAARLKIRRERNKAAAARCRKRRVDQINSLSAEVEQWEGKKRILEDTIAQLRMQKQELEYVLSQHRSECKLAIVYGQQEMMPQQSLPVAVKSEPVIVEPLEQVYGVQPQTQTYVTTDEYEVIKPKRPVSLTIAVTKTSGPEDVVIETPSNVVSNFGFDSLMTSTGLTPTSNIATPVSFSSMPTCSSQQRSSELDLNTPCNENVSLMAL